MNLNIIGHHNQKTYLEQAWQQARFPQSLLFVGPASIGKFSLALNVAYQIVTKENINFHVPISLDTNHPNLYLINSSKLITIDEVRPIHEFLHLSGALTKYKIVIINNAENLNINAANSLLKILEEPPAYSIIILIANHIYNIPLTLRSRLCTLSFAPPTYEETIAILKPGLKQEEWRLFWQLGYNIGHIHIFMQLKILYEQIVMHWTQKNLLEIGHLLEEAIYKFPDNAEFILELVSFLVMRLIQHKLEVTIDEIFSGEKQALAKGAMSNDLQALLQVQEEVNDFIGKFSNLALDQKALIIVTLEALKTLKS